MRSTGSSATLSYAILTGLLAGTFIGLVSLSTDMLALSGRVGVAASTLVAAALFNPLRVRVRRLVDLADVPAGVQGGMSHY